MEGPARSEPTDFASVNLSEPGADAVVDALDAAGIDAEAEVWSGADARRQPDQPGTRMAAGPRSLTGDSAQVAE